MDVLEPLVERAIKEKSSKEKLRKQKEFEDRKKMFTSNERLRNHGIDTKGAFVYVSSILKRKDCPNESVRDLAELTQPDPSLNVHKRKRNDDSETHDKNLEKQIIEIEEKFYEYHVKNSVMIMYPRDGWCSTCHNNIFLHYYKSKHAQVITGCPYCHISWCD